MERESFSSSKGSDSVDFESELTLSDKIKVFKSSNFDPQSYVTNHCGAMSEKEIRHLCIYLVGLKKASAEEMRKSVYANYASFIRTSKEISDLEGELVSLKNLLSSRANIIHGIADGVHVESLQDEMDYSKDDDDPITNLQDTEPNKFDKWLSQFLENLQVLLAERRVEEALSALDEAETVAEGRRQSLSPSALLSLQQTIMENRQKLADQLADATCQPSTNGFELRSSVKAMKQLGDGPRAHTLLLKSHQQKLQRNVQSLQPSNASSYTTALSHLVFSTIAQAANDSLAIFDDEPAFTSELVTWAVDQTLAFARLIKKNVVAVPAASGCLRVVVECVHICLGYCSLLEDRGLTLCPTLLKVYRPYLEQAVNANLKRIDLSTAAIAASDDWSLAYPPVAGRSWSHSSSVGSLVASQQKLSSSAHRFNTMIQELCEDIGSLEILQLSELALEGVLESFNSYVNMMINAFPGLVETEDLEGSGRRVVRMAETETQQIALLANALLLADELLPRATVKLITSTNRNDNDQQRRASDKYNRPPEQRELKRRLQRSVDRLRDSFCRHHALELIMTEDGGDRLSADMYLTMDEGKDEPEWFPSPIYQELFVKLTQIASIASDIFVGRERFATILLMRCTESVILWFSDDQNYWEKIEAEERPLGPLGLQQFYLDMEFVILFASQGRYLSRNLHQVMKNIISRAIEAVQTNNIDPYSVLPEDEWFADVAQIAIKMLTGQAQFDNAERDMNSPTASVSARSVSSVHSHGSS